MCNFRKPSAFSNQPEPSLSQRIQPFPATSIPRPFLSLNLSLDLPYAPMPQKSG